MPATVKDTADMINQEVETYNYFWAIGTIKSTLALWKKQCNYDLLSDVSKYFANHYLKEAPCNIMKSTKIQP